MDGPRPAGTQPQPQACPADRDTAPGVPGCSTSPWGRLRFTVSELRDLWRELRAGQRNREE